MGYCQQQLHDLEATIRAVDCDVIVTGTPFDLARLISVHRPIRRTRYQFADQSRPTLAELITARLKEWFPDRP
jgi:predicted GTPase